MYLFDQVKLVFFFTLSRSSISLFFTMLLNKDKTEFDSKLLLKLKDNLEKTNRKVFLMLKKDASSVHATDAAGRTLLHFAAEHANFEIAKYLLQAGAKVDAKDLHGNTPLMTVIKSSSSNSTSSCKVDMVKKLLQAGADFDLCDENGTSVWQMLCLKDKQVFWFLIDNLGSKSLNGRTIAEYLIDADCPLPIAVFWGDANLVKLMLDRGFPIVDPKTNESALFAAISESNAEIVKILFEYGADVYAKNVSGYTPLSWFGLKFENREKHLTILKILLDHGAQTFDEGGDMAISAILERGNRKAISLIFRYELDCRKKDAKNRTVLHYLACNDNSGIVDEVRSKDFDFNHADREGFTALHFSLGRPRFMEFLIKHGADVNATKKGSETPLFRAFSHLRCPILAKIETIELLLKYGADPQVKHAGQSIFEIQMDTDEKKLAIKPILGRLAELEAVGTKIDERIASGVQSSAYLESRYELCQRKIVRMKEYLVYKQINLFTLLTISEKKFACYMRNQELAEKFLKVKECVAFHIDDIFCKVLRRRHAELVEAMRLREKVADIVFEMSGFHYDRHHIIVNSIMDNFDLEELRKFDL